MGDNKIYLPAQRTRRGRAGYIGKNVVIVGSAEDRREEPEKAVVATEPTGPAGKASVAKGKAAAKADESQD